jgi:hypothetical protein
MTYRLFVAVLAVVLTGIVGDVNAADRPRRATQARLVGPVDPQTFVGTWNDQRHRFWFTVDRIVGNEVRAARFRLASLKSGHVDGDTLTLTSKSCVPVIGCYEYTHVGKLIGPGRMDMHGYSDPCRFAEECRKTGVVVNFVLVRE